MQCGSLYVLGEGPKRSQKEEEKNLKQSTVYFFDTIPRTIGKPITRVRETIFTNYIPIHKLSASILMYKMWVCKVSKSL